MAPAAGQEHPPLERHTISLDGTERTYSVHFPRSLVAKGRKPVVFVLHGGGGADAEEMAKRTGMNAIADREGFIVVYPYGADGQWNDGRGKSFRRGGDNTEVDDVGFISAILDELIRSGNADPRRIYVVGLSNGGMMAYRLGIALGNRLSAVAAIIANLPANLADQRPVRPIPVLIMNGTADPMMPWDGGPVRVLGREFGQVLSTADTVRYWVRAAGLPQTPEKKSLEDRVAGDRSRVEVEIYRKPQEPLEVVLYRIVGGGHNLPGGQTPDRPALLGPKNRDINAMEEVWAFFNRHTLATAEGPNRADAGRKFSQGRIERVGDPNANYLNVEFTADGRYMVWFEGTDERPINGIVWHCGVDPDTGDLIPPDGRGFRAFESTSWARANPGYDAEGAYYVGSDRQGNLYMVRPLGPREGKVVPLPVPPDVRRRAIYPTDLADRSGGFVFFIQNEKTPGAGTRMNGNSWVELQYLDLADPKSIHTIERQETPWLGFAPMDTGFARWMRHRPLLTYGFTKGGKVETRGFDAARPDRGVHELIVDGCSKIDPYGAVFGSFEYIFAGADATAVSHLYRRPVSGPDDRPFQPWKQLSPDGSQLNKPTLAQSHEPFLFSGRLYTVYQVNEQGRDFFDTTFRQPGEIWLADLEADPVRQWRIAPALTARVSEPEVLISGNRVWVFYSQAFPEDGPAVDQTRGKPIGQWAGARSLPRLALYRIELFTEDGN